MNVFVATYEHRHGRDISVFKTREGAEAWAISLATEYWEAELGQRPMPADGSDLADEYFHLVDDEYFDVEECEVV